MRRTSWGTVLMLASALAWTAGCRDTSAPVQIPTPVPTPAPRANELPALIASEPVPGPAPLASARMQMESASTATSVVYVSLPPGSVPQGLSATIRDVESGQAITAPVVDGGFDPVPIVADVGDTLVVAIQPLGSAGAILGYLVVRPRRPPVVVRTSPPAKKVDVPLNAIVVVVFSTPLDSATLDTGSVQLWRGTTRIAGTVGLGDALGLRAEFRPDSLLAGATAYQLVVTQRIQSVNGVALAEPVTADFTTATAPAPQVASISLTPGSTILTPDAAQQLAARAFDSRGDPVAVARFGWSSADARIASVSADGLVTAVGIGETSIQATSGGVTGKAVVTVDSLRFASVGAGHGFSCGLTVRGTAYCWGYPWDAWIWGICPDVSYYDWFPCGLPSSAPPASALFPTPRIVSSALRFTSLSVGWRHACGITAAGDAYCWGYAMFGQLGNGNGTFQGTLTPVAVAGGIEFKSISAGDSHTCGVAVDGAAFCWGLGLYGELGIGALQLTSCDGSAACSSPQPVVGGLSFASVSAGVAESCGLTTAGAAYCWGINAWGALGNGTITGPDQCNAWFGECSRSPVAVAGGHQFSAVVVAQYSACGLRIDGEVYCWGWDLFGTGPTTDDCSPWRVGECSTIPRPVGDGLRFTSLAASYARACATTVSGAAYCWGATCPRCIAGPPYPAGDPWESSPTPVAVPGGIAFALVSAGPTSHSCGVTATGVAYCWGDNSAGQLGDGTTTSRITPVRVVWQP